jgi:hypothetical protein
MHRRCRCYTILETAVCHTDVTEVDYSLIRVLRMDIHYISSAMQANEYYMITLFICGIRFNMKPGMNIKQRLCTTQLYSGSEITFNIINLATWPTKCICKTCLFASISHQ